jgi:hypothetical protein
MRFPLSMLPFRLLAVACVMLGSALGSAAVFAETKPSVATKPRVLTRVFFQDDQSHKVRFADLLATEPITLSEAKDVEGFPTLDPEKQSLVQMQSAAGMIVVGVRDEEDGEFQSGWVLIDSGVEEEEHGDHSHWAYVAAPKVRATQLDDQQGNPAHVYKYEGVFYLANDSKGGFTQLDPSKIKPSHSESDIRSLAKFYRGGSGHITLAAHKGLAYSTWIDRDGDNAGRVDMVDLSSNQPAEPASHFHLSSGGIHGAAAANDKIFFAPSNGIAWINAVGSAKVDGDSISVQRIDLGKDGETPRRTGAFTTHGKHVAFMTGRGESTTLGLIDASSPTGEWTAVKIPVLESRRAVGPTIVKPRSGTPIAFVFHDGPAEAEGKNVASIVDLDPNGDGQWNDAKISGELEVGKCLVNGHSGHHDIAFDANSSLAVISNPGDGTLTTVSLASRKPTGTFNVGGSVSRLISVGARGPAK